MANFLDGYSIQSWLESCPQGYLQGTEYGHDPGQTEPELLLTDPFMREQAISLTVQLVAGERCALAASAGLIGCAPDEPSKRFLATQTLDEARHVEIFSQRLYDLGVKKAELEDVVARFANPNLVKFAETLLERVRRRVTSSRVWLGRTSCSRAWRSVSSSCCMRRCRQREPQVRQDPHGHDRR